MRIRSVVPTRGTTGTGATNADSSPEKAPLGVPGIPQDRHSSHCGGEVETSGNYGRSAILSGGGVHVRLYVNAHRTVITPGITTARSGVGRTMPKPEGSRLRSERTGEERGRKGGERRNVRGVCARVRGVGEMNGGNGRGGRTEKRARAERGRAVREKEREAP